MALNLAIKYDLWKRARKVKEDQVKEVRDYVFATDTSTTANQTLPWKNKTTRPKLCQIRDNLECNYMAAMFGNDDYFIWMPEDAQSADLAKSKAIRTYMKSKLRESGFNRVVQQWILDFIDTGNVFGDTSYEVSVMTNNKGEVVQQYVGPKAHRISYYDVAFDITAVDFKSTPKIRRELHTMGDLVKASRGTDPIWSSDKAKDKLNKIRDTRREVSSLRESDIKKSDGLVADGFSSISQYYNSGVVEVLTFEGDLYDTVNNELWENRKIVVLDRSYIIYDEPFDNWFGKSTMHHCGWRIRPDNLMAMGPLDNLVGLQYRIDHLENVHADVFDLIAYPVFKIKGYVEDFKYGPLERIICDADADVEMMRPDTTALNAQLQIQELEMQMEEMAGAPKTAVGIRTPGEKTKFEVQTLDNAASRVFLAKIRYFEENFLEPILNDMLEQAARNIDSVELVRIVDDDVGVTKFLEITKEDLQAKGRLVPMGSRYFQAQAQLIQNLTNLAGTGMFQDPSIRVHFSGLEIAKLIQDNLGLGSYKIVEPNIQLIEQAESQKLAQSANDQVMAEGMTPTMTEEDIPPDVEEETDEAF
jgi:hypothetical protein